MIDRPLIWATALVALIGAAAPLWAVEGHPPYGFYSLLKLIELAAALGVSYVLFQLNKATLPLIVCVLAVAGMQVIGKMHKAQWIPWDWAAVGVFTVCALVLPLVKGHNSPSPS